MNTAKVIVVGLVILGLSAGSLYAGGSTLKQNPKYQTGGTSTGFPTSMCKAGPTGAQNGPVNYTLVNGQKVLNPPTQLLLGVKRCPYPGPQQANTPWVDNSIPECWDAGRGEYYEGCNPQ